MKKLSPKNRLYKCPTPLVGLTGGVATGKSTVSKILQAEGFQVVCADSLVKDIYNEPETYNFLTKEFPEVVSEHTIDFSLLRQKFFNHQDSKKKIEAFIYPRLPNAFNKNVVQYFHKPPPKFIIYDVPLLFEHGYEELCDITICIYASREIQQQRLGQRDQISPPLIEHMLDSQISIEDKKKKADYIVNNDQDKDFLQQEIEKLIKFLHQYFGDINGHD